MVIGKYSKIVILLSLMLPLFGSIGFAQAPVDSALVKQFENWFTLNMLPPHALFEKCVPVICLLRIDVDKAGIIGDLTLSDSADSLFRNELQKKAAKIDVKTLQQYCDHLSIKNKTFIIPLNYSYNKSVCTTQQFDMDLLAKYYSFNTKVMIGDILLLPAITVKLSFQY